MASGQPARNPFLDGNDEDGDESPAAADAHKLPELSLNVRSPLPQGRHE